MPRAIAQSPPVALKLGLPEFLELPDDGKRYEIIDGELFMTPSPNIKHQTIVLRLARVLAQVLDDAGLGRVFIAPTDVLLGAHDIVEPDLLFVRAERAHIIGVQRIEGAPDLVVEILSPSTRRRDMLLKKRTYARFGVEHYWLVDPEADRIERYRLGAEGYVRVGLDEAPAVIEFEDFPGLRVDLGALFG